MTDDFAPLPHPFPQNWRLRGLSGAGGEGLLTAEQERPRRAPPPLRRVRLHQRPRPRLGARRRRPRAARGARDGRPPDPRPGPPRSPLGRARRTERAAVRRAAPRPAARRVLADRVRRRPRRRRRTGNVRRCAQIKWPNNVLLGGHKTSGLLLEAPAPSPWGGLGWVSSLLRGGDGLGHSEGPLVLGIGVNVNQTAFPDADYLHAADLPAPGDGPDAGRGGRHQGRLPRPGRPPRGTCGARLGFHSCGSQPATRARRARPAGGRARPSGGRQPRRQRARAAGRRNFADWATVEGEGHPNGV